MASALQGRTALITGAAKRIGRAIALTLADAGVNIVIHYNRSDQEAKALAAEISHKGVQAWTIQADFSQPHEYNTLLDRTLEIARSFDILINNASIFPPDTLEEVTFESLMTNIEVNAWVPFTLSREFADKVRKGHIVNLHDSRLKGFDWNHVSYILSKHLLAELTRMMAVAYAPGIQVNAVAPGLILPPPGKDLQYIEQLQDSLPLRRHGDPQDIADAVAYLVSSDFTTGEVLYVDGGRHIREYPIGSNPH